MDETLVDRIRRLEIELRQARDLQANCSHEFSLPRQASREVSKYIPQNTGRWESLGSDSQPIYEYVKHIETENYWMRSCGKCGLVQETTKSRLVQTIQKYEPDFGGL